MQFPWRPSLPLVADGKGPLAVATTDFLPGNFPYERNVGTPALTWWMEPIPVFCLVLGYLLSIPVFTLFCRGVGIDGKSGMTKAGIMLHNVLLAVFSGVVFVNVWAIVMEELQESGWRAVYCAIGNGSVVDFNFWDAKGFGSWATIFYLSKYYEFVDTWILIIKNRTPSTLQVYHHAGIALTMWAGCASQGAWLVWVVCMNSGIHTVMYTYYFFAAAKMVGKYRFLKKYLTKAQIGQFLLGIAGTLYGQVLGKTCETSAGLFSMGAIQLYAVGLILLFVAFYKRAYKKKPKAQKKQN